MFSSLSRVLENYIAADFKKILNAMTQRNLTLFLSGVLKQRMKTGLE